MDIQYEYRRNYLYGACIASPLNQKNPPSNFSFGCGLCRLSGCVFLLEFQANTVLWLYFPSLQLKTVTLIEIGNDSALTMMNHVMGANSYFPITYKGNLLDDLFNIASVVWLIVALAAVLTLTIIYFITLGEMKDAQKN
ncbi:MAG: hypothetical protein L6V84_00500 [Oscillospiraceae bacterium]|nr:MAG: hypothetical protein L6V84_00500 [Oscillospiraceae bacterium]